MKALQTITWSVVLGVILGVSPDATAQKPHFASGIKIGELDQDSAIIWVRLTREEKPRFDKLKLLSTGVPADESPRDRMPVDVVPGITGWVKVEFWPDGQTAKAGTEWVAVEAKNDFIHSFRLTGLAANQKYQFQVLARSARPTTDTPEIDNRISGRFRTAPPLDSEDPVHFIVSTCQAVRSIDSGVDGHVAYQQMLAYDPSFFVHTGDILYYDKVPFCKTVAEARAKWNLMFAYRFNREFHRQIPSYFMKDDHDTLKNDCWPGQKYGELTFEQGLQLFREQVPMSELTYRTVRWGKHVQIWMTENRDYRSSNRAPDGPRKTILGEPQKRWLMDGVANSDATFKFIISPGPIVGPDKRGKADNHSNQNFAFEGQQLRDFLSGQKNTYVICGDRHWQYCSVDPQTGLMELGCGPINDEHMFGGNPGKVAPYHRYFGAKGGFLAIEVNGSEAVAKWFGASQLDPTTGQPVVLHSEKLVPVSERGN